MNTIVEMGETQGYFEAVSCSRSVVAIAALVICISRFHDDAGRAFAEFSHRLVGHEPQQ